MAVDAGVDSGCAFIKIVELGDNNQFIETCIPSVLKEGMPTMGGAESGNTVQV